MYTPIDFGYFFKETPRQFVYWNISGFDKEQIYGSLSWSGNKNYLGVLKVLPYFANVGHNSAAPDVFAEFMKVKNHSEQYDTELAWYSSNAFLSHANWNKILMH